MTPTDAWTRTEAATNPTWSKDGSTVWFLRGAGLAQVWAMDADGGRLRQVSAHDEKVALLRRSPADDALIWGIDSGGDERQQLWLKQPDGPARALTDLPHAIHDFGAWSPDGQRIALAANDRDERFFDVCVIDLATGARRRVHETTAQVSVSAWRTGTEQVVLTENHSSSEDRLSILDLSSGIARPLPTPGPTRWTAVRWVNDGAGLMGLTDRGGHDFMRLCRIDPDTGEATPVFEWPGRDVEAWSLSPDQSLLATVENDRGYAVLRVGVAGTEREMVHGLPEGVMGDLAWSPDSRTLAFCAQSPLVPAGIWRWDAASRSVACLFQPGLPDGIDAGRLVAPHLVSFPAGDGRETPGWFARPRDAHGTVPAVMWVHGGPASQTRANFRADVQMLLDQGYAVLMPNIRGSTGYGRAAMESDDNDLRVHARDDLRAAHAWLAAQPGIDAARIGIMGQSYGGWAVLAAITAFPELWRAAVDYYGVADFATLLERTGPWRRDHRAREYGFPDTHAALFEDISPLRHAHRVTAPLLVLHGDRDPRVPMHESDQFVEAMELHQKPVAYERFDYAGHGFVRPDHKRRVYAAVAAHFARHLRGGA